MAAGAQEDRLSDLPDGVLGHVLSFLSVKEAARAAVLSRRYHHASSSVQTLSLVQEETSSSISTGTSSDDFRYEYDKQEQRRNAEFVALADAAFSCRRRGAGGGADPGLRAFRVVTWTAGSPRRRATAAAPPWKRSRSTRARVESAASAPANAPLLDKTVRDRRPKELKDESDGEDGDDFSDPWTRDRAYRVPRWLFSSTSAAALRTLRLGSCFLDLPRDDAALHLPSVETLALTCVLDSGRDIQRLLSACGRLADLTLDSCRRVRALDVLGKRLRRLALRCCHGARLAVDASALRALEYKGPVPGEHVLSFAGGGSAPPVLSSCDIEFCGKAAAASSETELADMARFLGQFTAAKWLRLGATSMGASIDKMRKPSSLVPLPRVRRLELMGTLSSTTGAASAMAAVTRILEQTPNLEALTLLILPDVDERPRCRDEGICDPKVGLDVPGVVPPVIPCLRDRVREMNVVHYQGRVEQRALLKVLLRAATALEKLYVAFPPGKFEVQAMLMREIESWVMYRPVTVVFV
ncbi:unnamed protein product [Urochloa decumbens]|uniref:F-box domain-containing protein n=1 Tax=Urochloa decumbens TaxID=240449 RepID=A0ABC9DQB6_9POAL